MALKDLISRLDSFKDVPSAMCECVSCCEGEHAGQCAHCAGWGDRIDDRGIRMCNHCEGSGMCPVCNGANLPADDERAPVTGDEHDG